METTTPVLFFTRFVTHFCAPVFIFLTGTSASLYGQNKSKSDLSRFLWTRGLWLIFVEIAIMNFLWWFNPHYNFINLQVIWAIGLCMICLSALIYLPKKVLVLISLLVVFGHNTLDGITAEGNSLESILWYIFHQLHFMPVSETRMIGFYYPIVPWFAVMSLGYCFGFLFRRGFDPQRRKKLLLIFGFTSVSLFLLIRGINVYGDPAPWSRQKNLLFTLMSFINVSKYPPSLLYFHRFVFARGIQKPGHGFPARFRSGAILLLHIARFDHPFCGFADPGSAWKGLETHDLHPGILHNRQDG
jgi:uncharacterized membrane protein